MAASKEVLTMGKRKNKAEKPVEAPAVDETANKMDEALVDSQQPVETPVQAAPVTDNSDKGDDSDPMLKQQEGESTSAAIRRLSQAPFNKTPGQIAKLLGIRYQHAYNVLKRPLKGRAQ
jgi:hypothetical protein